MLLKLLKKEWALCLHPTSWIMLGLCTLILIPNYPYGVSFFYMTLAIFFLSMNARENHDVTFSMTLPVAKRDLVTGRFLLCMLLKLLSLLAAGLMILLHRVLVPVPNAAGMDANLALLGEGLILYGVFHLLFFPAHYRDVSRIGVPFLTASAAVFLLIVLEIVLCHALPLFRDVLDTPDPQYRGAKLIFVLLSAFFYALATWLALRLSQRHFQKLDIR